MRRTSPWVDEGHRSWRWVPRRAWLPRRTFDDGWIWFGQAYWIWECMWGWGFHDRYPYVRKAHQPYVRKGSKYATDEVRGE